MTELENEIAWLREGIAIALDYLNNDRKTLAMDALKATLTKQVW